MPTTIAKPSRAAFACKTRRKGMRRTARLSAISKADAADVAMGDSRWPKINFVPVDSTRMRRSLANGSRARASHASRARAGRSRQRQSKWTGSTRRCTRTALVTAPFLFGAIPVCGAHQGWLGYHDQRGTAQQSAMPQDPFIREKFTREHTAARKLATEYFRRSKRPISDRG
jgi:hypothetical protein